MRLIRKYRGAQNMLVEEYELNNMLFNCGRPGLVGCHIAYFVITSQLLDFIGFYGIKEKRYNEKSDGIWLFGKSMFRNFDTLRTTENKIRGLRIKYWRIRSRYQGTEIKITGQKWSNKITIARSPVAEVDINRILTDIEERSYNWHWFDRTMVVNMKEFFGLGQIECIEILQQISRFEDIFKEFAKGVRANKFVFPSVGAVEVEGMTAEKLQNELGLSILEAYQRLVHLRADPEGAAIRLDEFCKVRSDSVLRPIPETKNEP